MLIFMGLICWKPSKGMCQCPSCTETILLIERICLGLRICFDHKLKTKSVDIHPRKI